jgi:hypothetical protein
MPSYDAFLIFIAPVVLLVLHAVFARTRFGRLARAATEDREMLGALGVNQSVLFTAVFALGSVLAGLGGALQVAREPANLGIDLTVRCLPRHPTGGRGRRQDRRPAARAASWRSSFSGRVLHSGERLRRVLWSDNFPDRCRNFPVTRLKIPCLASTGISS